MNMDKSYLLETAKLKNRYAKYTQDLGHIFRDSCHLGKDVTAYVLRVLKQENDPDIGRALIETAFTASLTTVGLLKLIVKILYVTGHISAFRYGAYHALKKELDAALQKIRGNKAELVGKKYPLLLERLNKENIQPLSPKEPKLENKAAAASNLVDNINRQYINFV